MIFIPLFPINNVIRFNKVYSFAVLKDVVALGAKTCLGSTMFNLRNWASNSKELMDFIRKEREQRDLQAEPAVPAPVIDKPDSVSDNMIDDPENCKTVTQDIGFL